MKRFAAVTHRVRRVVADASTWIATRWKQRLYLYLSAIVSLFIVVDATVLHVTTNMRQAAFDTMVRYRFIVPKPDRDIVIVDIKT